MSENIYERIHRTLSWKRIIGFNVVLLLVLIVPLSVRLAEQDTENRSGAAGELEPSPIIPSPNYPVNPPQIDRVNAFFGKAGDTVVIIGTNFGDYQWSSRVFVGSMEAPKTAIVRWSPTILEVKIPEGARTGKVWVNVNGTQATWEGNLILYNSARSAQIGLEKISATGGRVFVTGGSGIARGMVELGYISEPVIVSPLAGVKINSQESRTDNLGKKLLISFELEQSLSSGQTSILEIGYPGIGSVEIVRAELFDQNGKYSSIFTDPLSSKLMP